MIFQIIVTKNIFKRLLSYSYELPLFVPTTKCCFHKTAADADKTISFDKIEQSN